PGEDVCRGVTDQDPAPDLGDRDLAQVDATEVDTPGPGRQVLVLALDPGASLVLGLSGQAGLTAFQLVVIGQRRLTGVVGQVASEPVGQCRAVLGGRTDHHGECPRLGPEAG